MHLFLIFLLLTQTACANISVQRPSLKIVTTIYPSFDWVHQIIGSEQAASILLLASHTNMHDYLPSEEDIERIKQCDMFIYVGGPSESWVKNIPFNKKTIVINLFDIVKHSLKSQDESQNIHSMSVFGMRNDYPITNPSLLSGAQDESKYDEHIWLSLKNASLICSYIANKLMQVQPQYKNVYAKNVSLYLQKLEELDNSYRSMIQASPNQTLIFANAFPYRYIIDETNVSYFSAYPNCQNSTSIAPDMAAFLAHKIDSLHISYVLSTEIDNTGLAKQIIERTRSKNQKIIVLNTMHIAPRQNKDYITIMKDTLETLKKVLQYKPEQQTAELTI